MQEPSSESDDGKTDVASATVDSAVPDRPQKRARVDDDAITDAQPPPPLPSDEELARLATRSPPLAAREETLDITALKEQLNVAIEGVLRGFSLRLCTWHVEYASNAADAKSSSGEDEGAAEAAEPLV